MLHIEKKFENVEWTSIITSIIKINKKIIKEKEGRKIKQKGDPEVDEPYKCWLILF